MRKRKAITGLILTTVMAVSAVASSVPVHLVTTHGEGKCYGTDVSGTAITVSGAGVTVSGAAVEVTEGAVEVTGDAAKIELVHSLIFDEKEGNVIFSSVYFGSYPQSEVTGEALTKEIVEADYAASGIVLEMTTFKGRNNYAISGEAVVMGEKYRRMVREDGSYGYFRYEPIQWRVMEVTSGQAVLMTEKIVDWQIYGKSTDGDKWTGSHICNWLNGYEGEDNGFYPIAFEKKEAVIPFDEGDNVNIFSFSQLYNYYIKWYGYKENNALVSMNERSNPPAMLGRIE